MARRTRNGRTQVDRAGIRETIGAAPSTVTRWHRDRAATGFPAAAGTDPDGRHWWWLDDITDFHTDHLTSRAAGFTSVDRTGDPDELLTAPQSARVLGYRDHRSLTKTFLGRPDDVTELPSGRVRRRWYRRTVWDYAANRTYHRAPGPPTGTASTQRKPHLYAGDNRLPTVRQLLDTGDDSAAIAARLGVSQRTAQRLINAARTD